MNKISEFFENTIGVKNGIRLAVVLWFFVMLGTYWMTCKITGETVGDSDSGTYAVFIPFGIGMIFIIYKLIKNK